MKKTILIFALGLFAVVPLAHAVCPVCTVAVGAGLGLAEWLGIDDLISGVWIGALIVSVSIWTITKVRLWGITRRIVGEGKSRTLTNKRLVFNILIFAGYYFIVVGPLWWKGMIGHPFNKFCGIDRLLFGIILGSALFAAGVIFHNYIRKRNNNVSYFKGQKIVFAVAPIIIASVILYFTC